MDGIGSHFSEHDASFTAPTRDLLHRFGDAVSALLYFSLLRPALVEVEGSVLLRDNIDGAEHKFRAAKRDAARSLPALEASFNLVEVAYLFRRDGVSSDALERKLAGLIADAWRDELKRRYPSRVFAVSVLDPDTSGSVHAVQFFEVR